MYAIIEESGSQRKVVQGDEIYVDLMNSGDVPAGHPVTFDRVLVIGEIGGGAKIGQPYVTGATVKGEVIEPMVKGEKLYIQKFQAKKAWQKKTGHRQRYTKVKVTAING
ncbi:MAG: 50S ribosomal protein L21 [Phycisphaeraceae bacterium]|nr:50S ribosomal protein L21 [Phycisphaeraceae bacterium]